MEGAGSIRPLQNQAKQYIIRRTSTTVVVIAGPVYDSTYRLYEMKF